MKNLLLTFLLFSLVTSSGLQAVTITTADGATFAYTSEDDLAALNLSPTISNLLEDLQHNTEDPIPLPNVNGQDWNHVMDCFKLMHNANKLQGSVKTFENFMEIALALLSRMNGEKMQELHTTSENSAIDAPFSSIDAYDKAKEKRQELHNKLANFTTDTLFSFINAVEYLGNDALLDMALEQWTLERELAPFESNGTTYAFSHTIQDKLQKKLRKHVTKLLTLDDQKQVTVKHLLHEYGIAVSDISYSPDGKILAAVCADEVLRIWDAHDYKLLYSVKFHDGRREWECYLKYNIKGDLIAAYSSAYNKVYIVDALQGKIIQTFDHEYKVRSIAFSPDLQGNYIAVASASFSNTGKVCIWNRSTRELIHEFECAGVTRVCFSPNGKYVAAGDKYGNVNIWETDSGNLVHVLQHGGRSYITKIGYTPDSNFIVSASKDAVFIWDVATGYQRSMFYSGDVRDFDINPCNNLIIFSYKNVLCRHFEIKKNFSCEKLATDCDKMSKLSYDPEGSSIACASVYGTLDIRNPDSGQFIHKLKHDTKMLYTPTVITPTISYSPDRRFIAGTLNTCNRVTRKTPLADIRVWDLLGTSKNVIDHGSYKHLLLLALGYQKKHNKLTLDLSTKPHLAKLFSELKEDEKSHLQQLLPIKTQVSQSLVQRAQLHRNKILLSTAGVGALGLLAWHYLKK